MNNADFINLIGQTASVVIGLISAAQLLKL